MKLSSSSLDVNIFCSNKVMIWYKSCASIMFDVSCNGCNSNERERVGVVVKIYTKDNQGKRNYLHYFYTGFIFKFIQLC